MTQVHFIALGGSLQHTLALALHNQGFKVTGSDDQFFNPSKGRLDAAGILPASEGWDASRVHADLNAVILGMHAKLDNPELAKANELGLKIYSVADYIYEQSKNKQRVVIAGSHGKTTITSMIIHVLQSSGRAFDYAVGASIKGLENQVKLSDEAAFIVIEGDEYLSSPVDRSPKFLRYQHHIGLISGIAWDHINAFPTETGYVDQFQKLIEATPKAGSLIYNKEDKRLRKMAEGTEVDCVKIEYETPSHKIKNGITTLKTIDGSVDLKVFGAHNLSNIGAALSVCQRLSIPDKEFFSAIATFEGAANRLQKLGETESSVWYKDFAHSPSKVSATTEAAKTQFPKRKLVACLELHTFSSLNEEFISQYKGALDAADKAVVYINPDTLAKKGNLTISEEGLRKAFKNKKLSYVTNADDVISAIKAESWDKANLLVMTSGNFGNIDFDALTTESL
jgi:UDP-N-acetylmuramate: L-alanyl-gamma-D-glutamyl-meso-diaminopimelate ligase